MRIGEQDASLKLDIERYQFPELVTSSSSPSTADWDANWLVISGEVKTPDGGFWSFRDPCLTTWEAQRIIAWLRDVATGQMRPLTGSAEPERSDIDHYEHSGWLSFTEPHLAFTNTRLEGQLVELQVAFNVEAAPPWARPGRPRCTQVTLETNSAQLCAAAMSLESQLAAFPPR